MSLVDERQMSRAAAEVVTSLARREPPACAWCGGEIRRAARRDAKTCSKACRQAKHRFRVVAAAVAEGRPMRFGFADPPYVGLARRYYDHDEVDHRELVKCLVSSYDGWALCLSGASLPEVLPMCPAGVRVGIWVRGSRPGVSWKARSSYEAVIVSGGRPRRLTCNEVLDDSLVLPAQARQRSHPNALVGMKPAAYCEWVFRMLGAAPGDVLVDLFPGSGAVTRAWRLHVSTA